ncbi:MAG: response regulator transcription factor [Actinoplanes sp.]
MKVLLVDDHRVFAESLALAIEAQPGLTCAGVATTVREALARAAAVAHDVAVVDLDLPDGSGLDLVAPLRAYGQVVILTAHPRADLADRALAEGASGFLAKDAGLVEIISAVRSATPDRPAVTPNLRRTTVALTDREYDVLRELGRGLDATRLAARLGISVYTARDHIKALMAKLDARTQLDAVVTASRLGLISPGSRY